MIYRELERFHEIPRPESLEPDRLRGLTATVESGAFHGDWDDFLTATPAGRLTQSSAWGRLKRTSRMQVDRLVFRVDGRIVGGAQLVGRSIGPLGRIAYLPYGPVLARNLPDEAVAFVAQHLREHCRATRIRALFVQPPERGEHIARHLRAVGFQSSDADVAPSASIRIDVSQDPEKLRADFGHKARRDLRANAQAGLTVRCGTSEDLASFHELHCCTARRQNFTPMSLEYLEQLWHELHAVGQIAVRIAEFEGNDVAGNLITYFGDVVTGHYLGFDTERLPRKLRPNELLIWETIRWAHEAGMRAYDLGGIPRAEALSLLKPERSPEEEARRSRHKAQWNGDPIVYPEPLELILNPALRVAVRGATRSRAGKIARQAVQYRLRARSTGAARGGSRHGNIAGARRPEWQWWRAGRMAASGPARDPAEERPDSAGQDAG